MHRSRGYSQLIVDELRAKTSAALPTPLAFSARDVAVTLWAAAALSLQLDVALVGNLLAIFDQHAVSARFRRRRRRANAIRRQACCGVRSFTDHSCIGLCLLAVAVAAH